MRVTKLLQAAQLTVTINKVIIWNPHISKVLFFGTINDIPKTLYNKEVKAYFYHKEKTRMIIRV